MATELKTYVPTAVRFVKRVSGQYTLYDIWERAPGDLVACYANNGCSVMAADTIDDLECSLGPFSDVAMPGPPPYQLI